MARATTRAWLIGAIAASIVLLFAGAIHIRQSSDDAPQAPIRAAKDWVAVRPFANRSPHHTVPRDTDDFAEKLLNALADIPEINLAAATVVKRAEDLQQLRTRHDRLVVVEGSVLKIEFQLQVSVQLIEVHSEYQIWSEIFNLPANDAAGIHILIAREIAKYLNSRAFHNTLPPKQIVDPDVRTG